MNVKHGKIPLVERIGLFVCLIRETPLFLLLPRCCLCVKDTLDSSKDLSLTILETIKTTSSISALDIL